uniref:GMP reductase n=1 Tax=Heterorhabditis bacteriophora TaxID=37862 RepID=A0A1I7X6C1_HETBA
MPRIENEPKLDFKDVLLRPKRSTLKSRADVDLVREYEFKNSKKHYIGIPVAASNMDTVGTFEMATALAPHKMFTTVHKHYTVEQWKNFFESETDASVFNHIAVSSGISDNDFTKLRAVCEVVPSLEYICLDVANGYSEVFVEFIRKVREQFPRSCIIVCISLTKSKNERLFYLFFRVDYTGRFDTLILYS